MFVLHTQPLNKISAGSWLWVRYPVWVCVCGVWYVYIAGRPYHKSCHAGQTVCTCEYVGSCVCMYIYTHTHACIKPCMVCAALSLRWTSQQKKNIFRQLAANMPWPIWPPPSKHTHTRTNIHALRPFYTSLKLYSSQSCHRETLSRYCPGGVEPGGRIRSLKCFQSVLL